jgi:hypothetical protein
MHIHYLTESEAVITEQEILADEVGALYETFMTADPLPIRIETRTTNTEYVHEAFYQILGLRRLGQDCWVKVRAL